MRTLAVVAVLGAVFACKKNPPPPDVTPPTAAEAETFARAYVAARVPTCDVPKLEKLVDLDLIVTRGVTGSSISKRERDAIRGGIVQSQLLCGAALGANLAVRYLRSQIVDGAPRPLLRLVGDNGLNYELLELDKRGDTVVAADIFNYASGISHSMLFRSLLTTLVDDVNATRLIKQLNQQRAAGKFADALDTFHALPAKVRTTREMMVIEVHIASNLDEKVSIDALDRFTKAFPNDPSMMLGEISLQIVHKRYDQAIAAMDRLDKNLGGDPYLDVMRADALMAMGKIEEAGAAAKRATTAEPAIAGTWWQLLAYQSEAAKFPEAIATLGSLKKLGAKVDRAAITADGRCEKLLASAELAEWETTLERRP